MGATTAPAFSADYRNCFEVDEGAVAEPARAWAQVALAGSSGTFGRVVWSGLLGFDLADPEAPGTLFGWHVAAETPAELVLTVDGSLWRAAWSFLGRRAACGGRRWCVTTAAWARPTWAIGAPVHRRLAPQCLKRARRRLGEPGHSGS